MSEIRKVTVELKRPLRSYPAGQVTFGYYTVKDGLLTMTDPKGVPAEDGIGKRYTHKLLPNESETGVACKLTRQLRTALLGGGNAAPVNGFDGQKIDYGKQAKYL